MNVAIFAGPTIDAAAVTAAIDAVVLPPVRQGDVYRVVEAHSPRMIGIVDGYFHQVPSVWHKEILWALSRGVAVFGSASMGALRAAELAPFGMVGVGVVYEAYRDARFPPYEDAFEDDDEVAVMHGPAELGYPAVSEALVNIRATLDRAARESVIDAVQRDALKDLARSTYYADRSWESLLQAAQGAGLACPCDRLRASARRRARESQAARCRGHDRGDEIRHGLDAAAAGVPFRADRPMAADGRRHPCPRGSCEPGARGTRPSRRRLCRLPSPRGAAAAGPAFTRARR
ncbi:MAG: TfuA domain-containing protein [Gammaproteobacteria bacterium]|nr:TfuA domain-containing protein [Gammaproteobacteria bacterium]